ncbi:MAG: alpha/beta hydrolase [Polyangiaceae bacterium]
MKRLLAAAVCALAPAMAGCLSYYQGPMPGEPKDATYIEVEGTRVRYRDTGEGPPVIMIHGFASSLETWDLVQPIIAKNHRVISLDLKGFGWTDRPEGDYSPWAEAKIVRAVMDRRGVERAAIVAHSWGSSVALALALGAPERVTKIALYDAWVYEDQIPTFFRLARRQGLGEFLFGVYYKERPDERLSLAFYDPTVVNEKLAEDIERAVERPGTVAAALAAVRGQTFSEVEKRYRTITKPTLLLWGREDVVTTIDFAERLSKEMPNSRLVVYPKCGHFPMLEAMLASTRELAKFLDEGAQ